MICRSYSNMAIIYAWLIGILFGLFTGMVIMTKASHYDCRTYSDIEKALNHASSIKE